MGNSNRRPEGDTIWKAIAIGSFGFPFGVIFPLAVLYWLPHYFLDFYIVFMFSVFFAAMALNIYGKKHMSWPWTAYRAVSTVGKRLYAVYFFALFCICGLVFLMILFHVIE